jgi:hypothetical protein
MTAPLVVSIPHRLGKVEAARRLKAGLGQARTGFNHLMSIDEEVWSGDSLTFRLRALGQSASGTIEVLEDHLRLEVALPWLLAKLSERLIPAIRKEGTLHAPLRCRTLASVRDRGMPWPSSKICSLPVAPSRCWRCPARRHGRNRPGPSSWSFRCRPAPAPTPWPA